MKDFFKEQFELFLKTAYEFRFFVNLLGLLWAGLVVLWIILFFVYADKLVDAWHLMFGEILICSLFSWAHFSFHRFLINKFGNNNVKP